MRYKYALLLIVWMGCIVTVLHAQPLKCGTVSPSPKKMETFMTGIRQAETARAFKIQADPIIYVPVKPWIVRKTDGSGTFTEIEAMRGLVAANQFYINAGIQFYFCGSFGYINDNKFYDIKNEDDPLLPTVPNVINLYYTNSALLGGNPVGGYTYMPANINNKVVVIFSNADYEGTVVHELGHYFGLLHTWDTGYGKELVSGANCTTAGDLICDTPADPYGQSGYSAANCVYTGTITDAEGKLYKPLLDNAMTYGICGSNLTAGQYARIRNTYTAFLSGLTCSSTSPAAPASLAALLNNEKVQLTWNDNATTEIGYIIERSDGVADKFISIGVTAPGATSFIDYFAPANQTCYYRIKPANAASAFSNTASVLIALGYCRPVYGYKGCYPAYFMNDFTLSRNGIKVMENLGSGCSAYNYTDFTNLNASLVAGSSYDFSITMGRNPDNTYQMQYIGIFIDFNQDGDFYDTGELVYQSQDRPFVLTASFAIPATAKLGKTRMRIRSKNYWANDGLVNDPCSRADGGEAEDYAVTILSSPQLAIQSFSSTSMCIAQTATLTYQVNATFNAGNVFTAYLSNAAGQFAGETVIGSVTAVTGGTITVTIPTNTPTGANYRIRLKSSSPAYITDPSAAISIASFPATPVITAGGVLTFCTGGNVVLTSSAATGNQWYKDGVEVAGAVNNTYTANASGTYTVAVTNAGGCSITSTNTVVTVNALPATPVITANGPATFCAGSSVTLTSSVATGCKWYRNNVFIGNDAVNASYTATTSGLYRVVATNEAGCSSNSVEVNVIVNALPATPTITAGSTTSFCKGGNVALTSSAATGNQWFKDGVPVSGAVNTTYTTAETGSYAVRTTNAAGCAALSGNTAVTVSDFPAIPIITAGSSTTFCAGSNVVFTSSAATGNQWFRDGIVITGAVNTTYTAIAAGAYSVKVSNAAGCANTSAAITATVNPAPAKPVITRSNGDLSSDAATGNQWFAEGVAVAGATSQIFRPSASGNYSVRVTQNGCNSLPSDNYYFLITAVTDPTALENKVLIFPNPIQDRIYITNNTTAPVNMKLLDIAGKQVMNTNLLPGSHNLPAGKLSSGTYLIIITDQRTHKTSHKKLIKQ